MIALRSLLARAARAIAGGGAFPDVSELYRRDYWPESRYALDFPRAAAVVPTVYACINRIAQDTASVLPDFHEGSGERRRKLERKPGNIVDLMARANPQQSGYELERDRQFTLDINGRGYYWLERFNGDPAGFELWVLPGQMVRPVSGPRRSVSKYHFGILGSGVDLDPENVIPFNYPNPNYDPLEPAPIGISPLEAARLAYETRFDMAAWQSAFYKRGGAVSHIFSIKDAVAADPKRIQKAEDDLAARGQGLRNAFKPIFVAGVEVHRGGLTQAEMRYLEAAAMTDADVCRVYGIPPVLMGIKEGGGLSDAGASVDMLIYWQHCVVPRVKLRDAVLTEWLCPLFGREIVCETDLSRVLPLQGAMLEQAKAVMALVGRPIFTVNDALDRLGLPPSESPTADALAVPFSVIIEGFEPEPVPATPPAPPPALEPARRSQGAEPSARREALRRRADADLKRYERRVSSLFVEFFTAQEAAAIARLRDQARRSGIDVEALRLALDPEGLLEEGGPDDLARLMRIYAALIAERGEAAAAEIGRELVLDIASGRIGAFIQAHADRALALTSDTTKGMLRDTLAQGIEAQESFSQLVARVRVVFDDRLANAATIARTETLPAYNFAALEAWRAGEVQHKEWLTVGDDAVRDEHRAADGQQVPIDSPFDVGQEPLLYPGDPAGTPANTINCRCVVQPVLTGAGLARLFARSGPRALGSNGNGNGLAANRIAALVAR